MPAPNSLIVIARALGMPVAELAGLPPYVLAFCHELLTYDGPEAGR